MRDELKKVQWKAKLFPGIAHCLVPDRDRFITSYKQRAVYELLEEYPNVVYSEVYFDLQKAEGRDLYESVEYFKTSDGRYIYNGGNFVSREWLENELSQMPATLTLTAWIKENEDEIQ